MRTFFVWVLMGLGLCLSQQSAAQVSTLNGWTIYPKDTIKVLIIFIQISDLPNGDDNRWKKGELPPYASWLVDKTAGQSLAPNNYTQFFDQMSNHRFTVLGSVYPELVTVQSANSYSYDDLNGKAVEQIKLRLAQPNPPTLDTLNLDRWQGVGAYLPKKKMADGMIDFTFFIYRNGDKTKFVGSEGGVVATCSNTLMGKRFQHGFTVANGISEVYPRLILTHEFGHNLLGDNAYHTAGGAHSWNEQRGIYNFTLASHSGWGLMTAFCSEVFNTANAWDRWRLGWLDTLYDIDRSKSTQTLTLRDFATQGDAIRIKLPNIPTQQENDPVNGVQDQYLWIENHQKKSVFDVKNFEPIYCNDRHFKFEDDLSKGLYIFQQIGRNNHNDPYAQPNEDFIRPISAEGNYDYELGERKPFCYGNPMFEMSHKAENPLSGYNDFDKQMNVVEGRLAYSAVCVKKIADKDSVGWSQRGDAYDAFTVGSYMGIGSNPSTASFPRYYHNNSTIEARNQIFLNGLSIKVLKINKQGDITLTIRFDDFDLHQDVRWCGDIVLTEKLHLLPKKVITLAQNHSPTAPKMIAQSQTFAPLTRFTVLPKATLTLEKGSKLMLTDNTTFMLRKESTLILNDAQIIANNGKIIVEEGANLIFNGKKITFSGTTTILKP